MGKLKPRIGNAVYIYNSTSTCTFSNQTKVSQNIKKKNKRKPVCTYMAYFRCMCPKAWFCCKALATDIAMKWSIFRPFYLCIMIPKVLLKIRQLNESSATVWKMALVWTFSWKKKTINDNIIWLEVHKHLLFVNTDQIWSHFHLAVHTDLRLGVVNSKP